MIFKVYYSLFSKIRVYFRIHTKCIRMGRRNKTNESKNFPGILFVTPEEEESAQN